MQQRDLLKEQIEQLGRVLGKIVSKFLDLKVDGNVVQGIQITNQQFKSELDIDIEKLLNLPKEDLADYVTDKQLASNHLEKIADYMEMMGEYQSDNAAKTNAFGTALNLLNIANEKSNVYDMERQFRIKEIKEKLADKVD